MNLDKYSKEIPMECPTCSNTDFIASENNEIVTCARCKRTLSKSDLIDFNRRNIQPNINATIKQITPEVTKEISTMLKKAFKNNKMFKIK